MADVRIGRLADMPDPGRKVLQVAGLEVGVFRLGSEVHAWENRCPHLEGPVCQGIMVPCTVEALNDDLTSRGREFAPDRMHIACPWHGYEFDVRTGQHPADRRLRLRRIPARIEDGEVWLSLPAARRQQT